MGKIKGTTKSQGKKHELDKFYTTNDIALYCIALIEDIKKYDLIIEPSAGSGPFGTNGNIALNFIKESSFADGIAFILPKSFKKESVKNRIPLNFTLKLEQDLPSNSFILNGNTYNVPCVFQYWIKSDIPRTIIKGSVKSDIIEFVDKDKAYFRIQRVGGSAGKASKDINKSISSNYFLKNISNIDTDILITMINNHIFPTINDTVGPRSLSKRELVKEIKNITNIFYKRLDK